MTKVISFPGGLRKVGREQPRYSLETVVRDDDTATELERVWIEFTPAQLLAWGKVRTAIFSATDVIPRLEVGKKETVQEVWERIIDSLTESIAYEEAPSDSSEAGLVYETALDFVAGLPVADDAEQFLLGGRRFETPGLGDKPSLMLFRSNDLREHLSIRKMLPKPRELWSMLGPRGFAAGVQRIGTRSVRAWWIRTEALEDWEDEHGSTLPRRNGALGSVTSYYAREKFQNAN